MTLICAYALTMLYDDVVKQEFYSALSTINGTTSPDNKLVILGDFNARVGTDSDLCLKSCTSME